MATYKIEFNWSDTTWTEYDVVLNDFQKMEILHKGLKSADATCSFSMSPNLTLYNLLRGISTTEVAVRILKDTSPYFYGYIRKTFNIKKTQKLEPIKIELVSPSFKLKKKISQNLNYSNITVTQLLTNLLIYAGVTSYNLPTISYIIPGFTVISDEGDTYYQYIEDILFEYGYVGYFDELGVFKTQQLYPSSLTTTNVFNGSNCLNEINQKKKEEEKEKVIVSWTGVKVLNNAIVFSDTTNAQNGYSCYIELPPSGYLGGEEEWYAELDSPEGEVLSCSALTLDIIKDADISVNTFEQIGNRVKISIKNNNLVSSKYIRKFNIIATSAVVKKSIHQSIIIKNINTEKVEAYTASYIYDIDSGNHLANILAWYYKYSDFSYSITSKTNYAIGDIVTVSDAGIGTNTARIISKRTQELTGIIQYELDSVDEYIPDVAINKTTTPSSQIIDINVEPQPSYVLYTSSNAVKLYSSGVFEPSAIYFRSFSSTSQTGMTPYDGVFKYYINDILQYYTTTPTHEIIWSGFDIYPSDDLYPIEELIPGYEFVNSIDEVESIRIELWDASNLVNLDSKSLTVMKDVSFQIPQVADEIYSSAPKYIGYYLDTFPTVFNIGDWYILYGETDDTNQRGIYRIQADLSPVRILGTGATDAPYIATVMSDLLMILSGGLYGTLADYGDITYIANLASNSVFTNALRVGTNNLDSTLIEGGKIKTSILDVDTILGNDAVFTGTLQATTGLFKGSIESGPMYLNLSPPASKSFTTTSKNMSVFLDEMIADGIIPGSYNCTGTYDSIDIGKLSFIKNTTSYTENVVDNYYQYTYESVWINPPGQYYSIRSTHHWKLIQKRYYRELNLYDNANNIVDSLTGYTWAENGWIDTGIIETVVALGTNQPAPTGTTPAGTTTATLDTGSISFTAGAFTMKLVNLPGYSISLPAGTVYIESDGSGNYLLKIRG